MSIILAKAFVVEFPCASCEGQTDIDIVSFIFDDTRLGLSREMYQSPGIREI